MSTTEDYVKRAEECVRLAGACIAESNREILLYAAARWRTMSEDASAGAFSQAERSGGLQGADRAQAERGVTKKGG
jgi:hypothetical protein